MPSLLDSPVTLAMIVFNLLLSVPAFFSPGLLRSLALEPYVISHDHSYYRIITAGFVHANTLHLALNMIALVFFGPVMEEMVLDATGSRAGYAIIYAVALLAGNIYPFLRYRRTPNYIALGASGAVSGIVLAFCLAEPTRMLHVFFFPMPAWLYAILFMGYTWYAMRSIKDGIAHEAHLAGAVGGMLAAFVATPQIISFL